MKIELIEAKKEDAKLLHGLQVKAFMPLYEKYRDDETSPAKENIERIEWKIENGNGPFYIIYCDDVAIGGIKVSHQRGGETENVNWISPVFIVPEFQNKGIAKIVMNKVFESHTDTLTWKLATIKEEERNCFIYEKLGFVKVGDEEVVNERMTLVKYEKNCLRADDTKITLVRPTKEHKQKALEYRQEHFDNGEMVINGSELLDKIDDYNVWLKTVQDNAKAETVNPEWVVTDTFFAVDAENEIIGIIDLRHTLNDFLNDFGNCGYSVRPSKRKKGYATEMLSQIIELARELGLKKLQLSVERDNIPSVKTIVKNGGVYERSFEFEGEQADIYIIKL